MAAGDITSWVQMENQATCMVVASSYVYVGTDNGKIYKYTISSGAVTTLCDMGERILSIDLSSTTLIVGLANGKIKKVATS